MAESLKVMVGLIIALSGMPAVPYLSGTTSPEMNSKNILADTTSGLTLMTVFSYAVSYLAGDNFKEPELLAILMKRLGGNLQKPLYQLAGWQLHYAVGVIFVSVYTYLWERNYLRRDLPNGLLLGFLSGIVGVGFWTAVFALHPDPPRIQLKKYYLQLMVAHLLFGAGASCFGRLNPRK